MRRHAMLSALAAGMLVGMSARPSVEEPQKAQKPERPRTPPPPTKRQLEIEAEHRQRNEAAKAKRRRKALKLYKDAQNG